VSTTNPERWKRAEAILVEALELPTERRASFLDEACGGDADLRREVDSLLAADEETGDFLATPLAPTLAPTLAPVPPPPAGVGERVGRYRLVAHLGSGGMGQVFLAERADGAYEQRVALKLIRPGMDTDELLRRFRLERQALARLQHPGIARLLDGGEAEDGQPYLVMEYVEGEPIGEHCARRAASLEERLALFRAVCAAVSEAHRNLIVHRDIKPSNVLVTRDGRPKLLDFGVAKLLAPDESLGEITRSSVRPMTPRYASPEQIRGEPATTAFDVYSLGAVLYLLLTGRAPHDGDGLSGLALQHAILEQEPVAPSRAIRESDPAARWRRRVAGDLDAIVLRALHKSPAGRYASVDELDHDVERYLGRYPVAARASSLAERGAKFVARNRTWVATACATLLSLALGLAASLRQWRRALAAEERARARLEQVREVARDLVFELHGGIALLPGSAAVQRTLLERGVRYFESLDPAAADDPELTLEAARGTLRLAGLWCSYDALDLARPLEALATVERSRALFEALPALDPYGAEARAGRIACDALAVHAHLDLDDLEAARAAAERALSLAGADDPLPVRRALAGAALAAARAELRADAALEALELVERGAAWAGEPPESWADGLPSRGSALVDLGRFDEGLAALRAVLARAEDGARDRPSDAAWRLRVARARTALGQALLEVGRPDEARAPLEAALGVLRERYAVDRESRAAHRALLIEVIQLGNLALRAGQPAAAIGHWDEAARLVDAARALWPDDPELDGQQANLPVKLAQAWLVAGDCARAEGAARRAVESLEGLLQRGRESYAIRANLAAAHGLLGHALMGLDRARDAIEPVEAYHARTVELAEQYPDLAGTEQDVLIAVDTLGGLHHDLARDASLSTAERRAHLERAIALWSDAAARTRALLEKERLTMPDALADIERSIEECEALLGGLQ